MGFCALYKIFNYLSVVLSLTNHAQLVQSNTVRVKPNTNLSLHVTQKLGTNLQLSPLVKKLKPNNTLQKPMIFKYLIYKTNNDNVLKKQTIKVACVVINR